MNTEVTAARIGKRMVIHCNHNIACAVIREGSTKFDMTPASMERHSSRKDLLESSVVIGYKTIVQSSVCSVCHVYINIPGHRTIAHVIEINAGYNCFTRHLTIQNQLLGIAEVIGAISGKHRIVSYAIA